MSGLKVEELLKQYDSHLYMSGFALQRYHSGPDGKKLRGSKRPDWKRVYIELKGNMMYRWEAGNIHTTRPENIAAIKIGRVQIETRQLEKFAPFDVVSAEFKWTGQHKSHSELQNLVEVAAVNGADKTYWNFGNGSIMQQWRSAIRMSRKHRRLILTKSLALQLPKDHSGDHIFKLSCSIEWAGGQIYENCKAKVKSDGLQLQTKRGTVSIKRLDSIVITTGKKIELKGDFKGSPRPDRVHLLRLIPEELEKAISFIAAVLTLPKLLQFHTMIEYARDPEGSFDDGVKTELVTIQGPPLEAIAEVDNDEDEITSALKSLTLVPRAIAGRDFTEDMFNTMLPLLIEPTPTDVVPIEFFYKALLNAWSVLQIDLAPSPQVVVTWMQQKSYKMVNEADRDLWIGFRLRPINYELYRRQKASVNKIQEIAL